MNVVAVGENLPLKDESIDLVFCTGMLRHAKDPVRVIAEIRRNHYQANLRAAIRVYIVEHYRAALKNREPRSSPLRQSRLGG